MHATSDPEVKDGEASTPIQPLSDDSLKDLVQLFKLLADETRLRIMHFLQQAEELNVLELCKMLQQRQPSVSHHLALLRVAGLIEMRRQGKHNYYRIQSRQFEQLINTALESGAMAPESSV